MAIDTLSRKSEEFKTNFGFNSEIQKKDHACFLDIHFEMLTC